jgi:predicted HicB family RNase H-like nuclease
MNLVRYKDYVGSVDFVDGKLLIKILYVDDIITTECDRASGAQKAFEDLVDDYIETCAEVGKEPSRPFKGSFNVRVSPSLHRSIVMCSMESGDSMNAWIEKALAEKVQGQKTSRRVNIAAFAERYFARGQIMESWISVSLGAERRNFPVPAKPYRAH